MHNFPIARKQILKRIHPDFKNHQIYVLTWLIFLVILTLLYSLLAIINHKLAIYELRFEQFIILIKKAFFTALPLSLITFAFPYDFIRCLPYWFYQYFLKNELKQDFQNPYYQVTQGKIIAIENIQASYFYKGQQKFTLKLHTGESIEFNLKIAQLYKSKPQMEIALPSSLIGQYVEICYLPETKKILQIWFINKTHHHPYYYRLSDLSDEYCDINNPPSKREYASLTWVNIQASLLEHHSDNVFQLNFKNADGLDDSYHSQNSDFEKFYSCLQQHYQLCSLTELQENLLKESPIVLYDFNQQQRKTRNISGSILLIVLLLLTYWLKNNFIDHLLWLSSVLLFFAVIIQQKMKAHRGWLPILPTT